MPAKTIKLPSTLYRSATFKRAEGEGGKLRMVASTDTPYKRYDWDEGEYWEILDHGPNGLDDERLKSPGLPVLFNHDTRQNLANARQYENNGHELILNEEGFIWAAGEFAENKKQDVESGALPHLSVGYEILDKGVEIGTKDGLPMYRFKWRIYEASIVPVPADVNAKTNRNRELERATDPKIIEISLDPSRKNEKKDSHKRETSQNREKIMTPEEQAAADEKERKQRERDEADAKRERDEKVLDGIKAAREREKEINDIASRATVPEDKKGEFTRALENAIEKSVTSEKAVSDFQTYVFRNFWGAPKVLDTPSGQGNGDLKPASKGRRSLSVGETFIQSPEVQAVKGRLQKGASVGVEIPGLSTLGIRGKVALAQRAGFTSSDLSAVNVTIAPGIIALGVQRLTIMDVIGSGTIGSGAYKYAQENSFGTVDGVAVAAGAMPRGKAVGERGIKPDWNPDLTTVTANVAKVAVTTKVPDEFLSDFPSAMSYIDDRLPLMVDTETEYQILYGDGLNNNLKGIFTFSGVQTRAITTTDDSTKAASIRQGLTDIQVGAQFEPDFIGFHPYDWETASLLKDSTGRFLAGGPFYIPYTAGVFLEVYTFWGKRVVVSTAITYGQPIAGCGKIGAAALIREGMRLEMTNSNEDDFKRNLVCLRAEHRLALPVYRPVSFIEFTGWPARA